MKAIVVVAVAVAVAVAIDAAAAFAAAAAAYDDAHMHRLTASQKSALPNVSHAIGVLFQ